MTVPSIHPAQFSRNLVAPIAAMLGDGGGGVLLDPCAGLGHRLFEIAVLADWCALGIDIERDRYGDSAHECVHQGDATALWFPDGGVDGAVVSFAYPNGMSDSFHSKENSVRHTYVHRLRAALADPTIELHPNNMGGMSPRRSPRALARFYETQAKIIGEVFRVLGPGDPFVVNTKDPDKQPDYTAVTQRQLLAAGFHIEAFQEVEARGLNHGANRELKANHENLTLARRPLL